MLHSCAGHCDAFTTEAFRLLWSQLTATLCSFLCTWAANMSRDKKTKGKQKENVFILNCASTRLPACPPAWLSSVRHSLSEAWCFNSHSLLISRRCYLAPASSNRLWRVLECGNVWHAPCLIHTHTAVGEMWEWRTEQMDGRVTSTLRCWKTSQEMDLLVALIRPPAGMRGVGSLSAGGGWSPSLLQAPSDGAARVNRGRDTPPLPCPSSPAFMCF